MGKQPSFNLRLWNRVGLFILQELLNLLFELTTELEFINLTFTIALLLVEGTTLNQTAYRLLLGLLLGSVTYIVLGEAA